MLPIDLRSTSCTRAAVSKQLGPLSFLPSHKKRLFHPIPLSISLDTLETIAAASTPTVALYSAPLQSTFRIHIDKLFHHSRDTCAGSLPRRHSHIPNSTSYSIVDPSSTLASDSSEMHMSMLPVMPSLSRSVKQPSISPDVSPFYRDVTFTRPRLARHDLSSDGDPDSLAVVRPPPPWNTLEHEKLYAANTTTPKQRPVFGSPKDLSQFAHRRFNKRTSSAVSDMVNMLASKRQKCEMASAPPRVVSGMSHESRNPFSKRVVSVFSKTEPASDDAPPRQPDPIGSSGDTVDDLPHKARRIRVSKPEPDGKPLKPITSLKAPVLPKEYLPCPTPVTPQVKKPKASLKQARLSFPPACPPAPNL